ncbi:MAG: 4Fe-4S dicluster domain-containing protein [Spirochaetes bacterium]|nr:4Fe-4S dicluster domain-containing protein [Spirochaetota bacterium]
MFYYLDKSEWNSYLLSLSKNYLIYAPFQNNGFIDFQLFHDKPETIIYHSAKTITPLKHFLFPLKEKVTDQPAVQKVMVIGAKSCDLAALDLFDKIFLDDQLMDDFYRRRRENTLIIGTDCHSVDKTCHCTVYDIKPFPEKNCDLTLVENKNEVILSSMTKAGEMFLSQISGSGRIKKKDEKLPDSIIKTRKEIGARIAKANRTLPNSKKTQTVIDHSIGKKDKVWKKYASTCVSCGACVISCPTCHCFILLDTSRPGVMEKIRNHDACQYPGFEKMASGVDPLEKHYIRFRNRYVCKYVNRPQKFKSLACTGCGRCIDTCIGKIDKNEVILACSR